ncbi:MAG TPA: hypothetical protein DD433_00825 [Ruminococcaceae bacterium]|nr:hypothetical protein [Oscillospiraceae bacterium]
MHKILSTEKPLYNKIYNNSTCECGPRIEKEPSR